MCRKILDICPLNYYTRPHFIYQDLEHESAGAQSQLRPTEAIDIIHVFSMRAFPYALASAANLRSHLTFS